MRTIDNSRYLDEKYSEGYTTRCREIALHRLILVENCLYELTYDQFQTFNKIRKQGGEYWHESLDYITANCNCINNNTLCYNY